MPGTDYPQSVIEVLDDEMDYPPMVLEVVERFALSGPWRGSLLARKKKFRMLNHDLSACYGMTPPDLRFGPLDGSHSGASHYHRPTHHIMLSGKLSVVTALHEFGHAMGMDEQRACRWSINLFRRCFPRQYARLVHVGHTLVRPEQAVTTSRSRTP